VRIVPRTIAATAALVLAVGALAVPVITTQPASAAPAPPVAAPDLPVCPAPGAVEHRNTPIGTDANVSVFVGGDYTVGANAAESEGVLAVGGTATFDKATGGIFNVGVAGVGSGVVPPPGSDMLLGGGAITSPGTTRVDVGHGIGGNVVSGADVTPIGRFETNGGTISSDQADPLGPFADYGSTITAKSAQYAALAPTGTSTSQYSQVTFAGDGTSATQVFTIPGNRLGQVTAATSVRFTDVPAGARVIVNVTGSTANVFTAGFFTGTDPTQITFGDDRFVQVATHTLWNFPQATSLTVGVSDQFLGSILVPRTDSTTRITSSTNGRVLVNGDMSFIGEGNEAHSFPFPDDDFECKPVVDPPTPTGGLSVLKRVVDPAGVVDPDQEYVGTWSCSAPGGAAIPGGSWRTGSDGTPTVVAQNLPVGSTCSISETPPAPPRPSDPSYGWATPVVTPSTVTIGDGTVAEVTVTNTVQRSTGGFDIAKALDDPTGAVDPGRTYTGEWTCSTGRTIVAAGEWSVTAAGTPQAVTGVPVGARCTVTEDTPSDPVPGDPSAIWAPPTISPSTITVGSGQTPTVTVTNRVERVTGSFAITKSVSGPGGGYLPGARFGFTWTCTAPDGTVTGPTSVAIGDGAVAPVDGIAAGSDCTVTEGPRPPVEDQSYEWLDPEFAIGDGAPTIGSTASFTVPAGGGPVVRVAFTNVIRQQLGVFSIRKVLVDPQRVTAPTAAYHGNWGCTFDGRDVGYGAFEVTADGAAHTVALNLPYGTRCFATEDLGVGTSAASDDDAAFIWSIPVNDVQEVVIGGQDTDVGVVRITNTVEAATTSATIAKVVDDPDGVLPTTTTYSGEIRCVAPDGQLYQGPWSVRAGQAASPLIDGVPEDSTCTVTETTPAPPDADHAWEPPVVSPASFVTHAGVTVAVTVRNVLPAVTVPPTDPPTVPPTQPPGDVGGGVDPGGASRPGGAGGLAFTGAELAWPAGVALAMLIAGAAVLRVRTARRRRGRG